MTQEFINYIAKSTVNSEELLLKKAILKYSNKQITELRDRLTVITYKNGNKREYFLDNKLILVLYSPIFNLYNSNYSSYIKCNINYKDTNE
jgi:hypothetical protein